MTTDLVELRKLADAHERLEQGGGASVELYEAADEIEQLRAEVTALEFASGIRAAQAVGMQRMIQGIGG